MKEKDSVIVAQSLDLPTLACENPGSNTALDFRQIHSHYLATVYSAVRMSTWVYIVADNYI